MGRPGAGKSYLAAALARDLALPRLDIADQPGHLTDPALAWSELGRRMTGPAVVESAGTSRFERAFWRGRPATIVVCAAPDEVRKERLQVRPEARTEPGYVRRLLAIPLPQVSGTPWLGTDPIPGPRYDRLLDELRRFLAPVEEFIVA